MILVRHPQCTSGGAYPDRGVGCNTGDRPKDKQDVALFFGSITKKKVVYKFPHVFRALNAKGTLGKNR
jgi:hypothetical protein